MLLIVNMSIKFKKTTLVLLMIIPIIGFGQIDTVETIDKYGWKEMKIYKDGRLEGMWKKWDSNGQLRFESDVTYGKRVGWEKWFYKNGQIWVEGHYLGRQKNGPWKMYYENGQLDMELHHKNGQIISKKCWDEDGNKIECEE